MQTATAQSRTFFDRMSSPSPAPTYADPSSPFAAHAAHLHYTAAASAAAHQQRSDALTLAVLHIDRSHLLLRKLQHASTQLLEQTLDSQADQPLAQQDQPLLTPSTARRLLTLEEAQLGAHRTLLRLHSPASPTCNPVEAAHAWGAVLRSQSVMVMLRNWMASRAFAEGDLQTTEQQLMKAQAVIDSAGSSEELSAAATPLGQPCPPALQAFQRVQAHTWNNLACVLRFTDPARGVQWAKRTLRLIRTTRGLHARSRAECAQDASLFHGDGGGTAAEATAPSHFALLFDLVTPPPSLFDAYPIALLCVVDCLGAMDDPRRAAHVAGKAAAFLKQDFQRTRRREQRRRKKREQDPQQQQQEEDDDAETARLLQEKALVIASAYSTLASHQSTLGQLDHAFINYSSAHAIALHFLGEAHEETQTHADNLEHAATENQELLLSEREAREDARERQSMENERVMFQQQQQQHYQVQQPPRMLYLRQHLTSRSEPQQQQQQQQQQVQRPPQHPLYPADSRSASEYSESTLNNGSDRDHDHRRQEEEDDDAADSQWLSDESPDVEFDQHSHHSYQSPSQDDEANEEDELSRSSTPAPTVKRTPSVPSATAHTQAAATSTPSPREAQLARLASPTRGQSATPPVDRPLCIEAAFEPSPHSIVAPVTPSAAARIAHTRGASLELRRALSTTPPAAADLSHLPAHHERQPSATGLRQTSTSLAPSSSRSQLQHRRQDSSIAQHRRQDSSIARQPSASSSASAASGSAPNSSRGRPAPLRLPSEMPSAPAANAMPFLLRSPSVDDRPAEPLWLGRQHTPSTPGERTSLAIPSSHIAQSSPRLQHAPSSSSSASPRPRSPLPSGAFLDVAVRPSSQRSPSMVLVESIMQSVKIAEAVRKNAIEDAEAQRDGGRRVGKAAAPQLDPAAEYSLELSIKKAQHDAIAATLAPEDVGRVDLIYLMQEQTAAEMQHELAKSAHASSAEEQLRRKLLLGKQKKKRNQRGPSMVEREFFAAASMSPKLASPSHKHVSRPSFGGGGAGAVGGGHARNPSLARLLSRPGNVPSGASYSAASQPTSPPVTSADVMDAALSAVLIAEAVRNEVIAAHAHSHARTSPADLEAKIHEAQSQAIVASLAPDERERASFLLMLAQSAQHQTAVKQHATSQAAAQESEWQQKLARGKNRRAQA